MEVNLQNESKGVSRLIGSGDIQAANRIANIVIQGLSSSEKSGNETESEEQRDAKKVSPNKDNICIHVSTLFPGDV